MSTDILPLCTEKKCVDKLQYLHSGSSISCYVEPLLGLILKSVQPQLECNFLTCCSVIDAIDVHEAIRTCSRYDNTVKKSIKMRQLQEESLM